MKKTIRVIDLFYKMANGEEVPKRIRLFGDEFKKEDNEYYSVCTSNQLISYFGEDYLRAELNDEIEILDEEDEFIDINGYISGVGTVDEANIEKYIHILFEQQAKLIQNQKKIIERINKEN